MAILDGAAGVDVARNAAAPLADWAEPLQARGRFADGGRGPVLFDCMGVALFVQSLVGRAARSYAELYRGLDIARTGAVDALFRAEADAWVNVPGGDVGDVLVLGHGGLAHHVAVLCGAGSALHARRGHDLRIERIEGRRAVTRFAGMKVFGVVRPG